MSQEVSCSTQICALLMTITLSTKSAWPTIIITTESARSSRIRENQSMPYTVNAVHGPIRVPCSTRGYSISKQAQASSVDRTSQSKAKAPSLKPFKTLAVQMLIQIRKVIAIAPNGPRARCSQMSLHLQPMSNSGSRVSNKAGRLPPKMVTWTSSH